MDSTQWSAKQTATGFSVSSFWPRQVDSASPVELQPADHSNTSMCSPPPVDSSDYDCESVEQAVDLNACTAVEYELLFFFSFCFRQP